MQHQQKPDQEQAVHCRINDRLRRRDIGLRLVLTLALDAGSDFGTNELGGEAERVDEILGVRPQPQAEPAAKR